MKMLHEKPVVRRWNKCSNNFITTRRFCLNENCCLERKREKNGQASRYRLSEAYWEWPSFFLLAFYFTFILFGFVSIKLKSIQLKCNESVAIYNSNHKQALTNINSVPEFIFSPIFTERNKKGNKTRFEFLTFCSHENSMQIKLTIKREAMNKKVDFDIL